MARRARKPTLPPAFGWRMTRPAFGIDAGAVLVVETGRPPHAGSIVVVVRKDGLQAMLALDGDASLIVAEDADGTKHRISIDDVAGVATGAMHSLEAA